MAARKMCFVLIKNKTKSFHVYCVINKQYCEQRETQREEMTPPLLCPPNSLSCMDSVSLGRAGVSEKVNLG